MRIAHFQVAHAQAGDGWLVRFGSTDYTYASRGRAIGAATRVASRIARYGCEAIVFIQPELGERWVEWRPGDCVPMGLAARRKPRKVPEPEGVRAT